jgi:hypothetical protein
MVDQRPIKKKSYAVTERKAKTVDVNHVSLELDGMDAGVAFFELFLDFELRKQSDHLFWRSVNQFLARTCARAE